MTPSYYFNSDENQNTKKSSFNNFGSQSNQKNKSHQRERQEEAYSNSLKKGKIKLSQKDFKNAKKDFLSAFSSKKTIEIAHLLSTCFSNLKEYEKASEFFEQNLHHYSEIGPYWGILALHHYLIEDEEGAAGAALKAIEEFNIQIPEIWKIFVYSAKKLNQVDLIYDICKKHSKLSHLNPYIIEGYITGCCSTNNYEEANDYIKSIGLTKDNALRFGEISSSLCTMVAAILEKTTNDIKEELSWNLLANQLNPDNSPIRWNLSLSQLKNGQIEVGANNYEARFNCKEFVSPIEKFRKPKWNKNIANNSKILLWYEQGIGDELRFLSALPFFIEDFPNVIIEPSDKILGLLQNSFSKLEVRKSVFYEGYTDQKEDFDYHLPMGSMFYYVIEKYKEKFIEKDFSLLESFLEADHLRVNYWKNKLKKLTRKPKIGFCWRSGLITPDRSREYSTLDDWKPLLTQEDFSFVNLQYDIDYQDFTNFHPNYSANFLETGFLDQKNDIEGAASLISNLDFVISAGSSPSMVSNGLGIPTLVFCSSNLHWLGRTDKFSKCPLFKNSYIYPTFNASEDPNLVSDVSKFINRYFTT